MAELDLSIAFFSGSCERLALGSEKMPTSPDLARMDGNVGVLGNESPGRAGLLFV